MRIATAQLHVRSLPLRRPYVLSFVVLREITAHVVDLRLEDGRAGLGEAVALPGYGDETDADLRSALESILPALAGRPVGDARARVLDDLAAAPFARSAVLTALEIATGELPLPDRLDWPVVGVTATAAPDDLLQRCRALHDGGFRTIKIKVGRDVEADIAGARALLPALPTGVVLRFDANQAFDEPAARAFLDALAEAGPASVELLEQPLLRDDWDGTARLARSSPVPIMMDESIYDVSDVGRAAEIGARFVKLKLCKHPGPSDLLAVARRAADLGLGVVLGNGVATDIGNLAEAAMHAAAPRLFAGAGEGNGFAKLRQGLLAQPPALAGGHLTWRRPAADGLGPLRPD